MLKAKHAVFPYSIDVNTYDSDGNTINCGAYMDCDPFDESIPLVSECTMTASEWLKEYGQETLQDIMEDGDVSTAEITIMFYENFIDKSYREPFLESTCTVNVHSVMDDNYSSHFEYEITECDDDEIAQKEEMIRTCQRPTVTVVRASDTQYIVEFQDGSVSCGGLNSVIEILSGLK